MSAIITHSPINMAAEFMDGSAMPLLGIHYFVTHPSLWCYFLAILFPQILLTLIVFCILFTTVYMIQSFLGIVFNGPIGLLLAAANFIHQVDLVSQIIASQLLYPAPLRMLFDSVLSREGYDDVVIRGKLSRDAQLPQSIQWNVWLWDLPYNIFLYPLGTLNFLLTVVLTFVPFVGPILLVFINAPSRGKLQHSRYCYLKGFDYRQQGTLFTTKMVSYIGFGIVCGILQQIPLISTFFAFTTTTGAALWAAKYETVFDRQRNGEVFIKPGMSSQRNAAPTISVLVARPIVDNV